MGMFKNVIAPGLMLTIASPLWAASGPFFSLRNTDFVVLISFILFALVLVYLKVPSMLGKMLDQRAVSIKTELDEARALREEAQTILASYERKQKEVSEQAARIVEDAKTEAKEAAEQAKIDLEKSVERKIEHYMHAPVQQYLSTEIRSFDHQYHSCPRTCKNCIFCFVQ